MRDFGFLHILDMETFGFLHRNSTTHRFFYDGVVLLKWKYATKEIPKACTTTTSFAPLHNLSLPPPNPSPPVVMLPSPSAASFSDFVPCNISCFQTSTMSPMIILFCDVSPSNNSPHNTSCCPLMTLFVWQCLLWSLPLPAPPQNLTQNISPMMSHYVMSLPVVSPLQKIISTKILHLRIPPVFPPLASLNSVMSPHTFLLKTPSATHIPPKSPLQFSLLYYLPL